ncbi:MAG TPA: hydrogenase maturation nickel metallochaperone HypA [Kineosporiaceae bacterium]
MHELSMAHAVVRTVAEAVPGRRVTCVTLQVGVASGVVPDALRFAWDVAVSGTALDGARLEIASVPLRVTCRECGMTSEMPDAVHVRCAACGGREVRLDGGRELRIETVEVDDVDHEAGVAS